MEKHIIQTLLESTIEDAGPDSPISLRSYSGRCMYGADCLGVTAEDVTVVYKELISALLNGAKLDRFQKTEIMDALEGVRTDNMGRDQIVYFPGIEFVDGGEQDESESEDEV